MPPPSAMAGGHCTAAPFLLPFATLTQSPSKPLRLCSAISIPTPSRLVKRKNYLRQKLLKTLSKPYPNPLLPQTPPINPVVPIQPPHERQLECPSDQLSGEACHEVTVEEPNESEAHEFGVAGTSEFTGLSDGGVGKFSPRLVLKIGLWLVGAFLVHTICAVWVFGSAHSENKNGDLCSEDKARVLELGVDGNDESNSKLLLNKSGNFFRGKMGIENSRILYADENELEDKIQEIRAMARDARERERLESKASDFDANNDDDDDVKAAIEKEIDNRLVKLRKSLQTIGDKSLVSSATALSRDDNVKDKGSFRAKGANGSLMFRKKYKFRGPSTEPGNKPSGFMGSEDRNANNGENGSSARSNEMLRNGRIDGNAVDLGNQDQKLDLSGDDLLRGGVSINSEDDGGQKPQNEGTKSLQTSVKEMGKARGGTKLGNEVGAAKTEPKIGLTWEKSIEMPSVEATNLREISELKAQNSQSFIKENLHTTTISSKSKQGSLPGKEIGNKQSVNRIENKASDIMIDSWWLSLPYVLAILMQRGHDGEGPQGLFTLKSVSHPEEESSHTVAFEDHGDATNFCYLLQSFFEDLGDFSADIVPLSIKELGEAVKSHAMKVLVVKKGQLKLYAGQPLDDVEKALHSLVGQS